MIETCAYAAVTIWSIATICLALFAKVEWRKNYARSTNPMDW